MRYEYRESDRYSSGLNGLIHKNQIIGRCFSLLVILIAIPVHAVGGAFNQVRDGGIPEFCKAFRMAFGKWKMKDDPYKRFKK